MFWSKLTDFKSSVSRFWSSFKDFRIVLHILGQRYFVNLLFCMFWSSFKDFRIVLHILGHRFLNLLFCMFWSNLTVFIDFGPV